MRTCIIFGTFGLLKVVMRKKALFCHLFSALISGSFVFVILFQAESQLSWVSVIAFLADWFQVNFVKLGLDGHFLVTGRTSKVIDAPCFVECCEHIPLNDLVANITKISKELMVMSLTISQSFAFIMSIAQEWLLAFGTDEMFHTPMLA